jgi:hypothetical protein
MNRPGAALLATLLVAANLAISAQTTTKSSTMMHAKGTFDIKMTAVKDSPFGRQVVEKQYQGDLSGTATGEMLAAMGTVQGSATYVAIEKVSGTLGGKKGEFALHHVGTMSRGKQSLVIEVVPDSGTGELTGLTGTMTIDIKDGKHFYGFDYTIAK